MTTLKEIETSIDDFINVCGDKVFSRSYDLKNYNEKNFLPLLRFFLAGRFPGLTIPEHHAKYAKLKRTKTYYSKGRVDFIIGNIAVEFAVRPSNSSGSQLSASSNYSEIEKLALIRKVKSRILILLDFSSAAYDLDTNVTNMKDHYSDLRVGKGNKIHSFHVYYYEIKGAKGKLSDVVIK